MEQLGNNSKFHVILIGDESAGKSFYFSKLTGKKVEYTSTIGIYYGNKIVEFDNKKIQLQIWDTSGQERYRNLPSNLSRNNHGIILLYNITNRNSYTFVTNSEFSEEIKLINGISVKVMLIGNNCENEGNRQVTTEEAKIFASTNNMLFFEVSTIINKNIEKSIIELTKEMLKLPKPIVNNENKLNLSQTGKELKHNYISKK